MKSGITWRSTFPECEPGTGVALFRGARHRPSTEPPGEPKPWMWSVTDPTLAGRPGWPDTHGEMPSRHPIIT